MLAATAAGCSPIYVDWDNHTIRTTPAIQETALPPATTPPTVAAPHRQASIHRKHKGAPASSSDMQEMTIEPDTTQNPTTAPDTATISMAIAGDTSSNAEKAIASTSGKLAQFDRSRLTGASLSTYDEANGFLNQGKQALAEKDYVAAAGFAQKASVLADKLQAR